MKKQSLVNKNTFYIQRDIYDHRTTINSFDS